MRLYDLIETTKHDLTIVKIANIIVDYIKYSFVPYTHKVIKSGNSVVDGRDRAKEWAIFSGKQINNGYLGGYDISEFGEEYATVVANIGYMVDYDRSMDHDTYEMLKNVGLIISPLYDHDKEEEFSGGFRGSSSNEQRYIEVSSSLLSDDRLAEMRRVIAHELRHTLDDIKSEGKAIYTGSDQDKLRTYKSHDEDEQYLRSTHEGNARYLEAVSELNDLIDEKPEMTTAQFKDVIERLIIKHKLNVAKDKKQQNRFVSRAWKVYNHIINGEEI